VLTLTNLCSPESASKYFRHELSFDNRFSIRANNGSWHGEGSKLLGLAGEVSDRDFRLILRRKSPITGQLLRPRAGKISAMDYCYSVPKSVSLQAMVDPLIEPIVKTCIESHLAELSNETRVRDRRGTRSQKDLTRPSKKIVAVVFHHLTSRENDPDLHAHIIISNLCYDESRSSWFALNNQEIFKNCRYFDSTINNSVASELRRIGYEITPTKTGFEISGVSPQLCLRFSKRTQQISRAVTAMSEEITQLSSYSLRTGTEETRLAKLKSLSPRALNQLANKITRKEKSNISKTGLKSLFWDQLTDTERTELENLHIKATCKFHCLSSKNENGRIDLSQLTSAMTDCFADGWIKTDTQILETVMRSHPGLADLGSWRLALTQSQFIIRKSADQEFLLGKTTDADITELIGILRQQNWGYCPPLLLPPTVPRLLKTIASEVQNTTARVIAYRPGSAKLSADFTQWFSQSPNVTFISDTTGSTPPTYYKGQELRTQKSSDERQKECAKIQRGGWTVITHADDSHPSNIKLMIRTALATDARVLILDQGGRKKIDQNLVRFLEKNSDLRVISSPPGSISKRSQLALISQNSTNESRSKTINQLVAGNNFKEIPMHTERHEAIAESIVTSLLSKRSALVVTAKKEEANVLNQLIRDRLKNSIEYKNEPAKKYDVTVKTLVKVYLDTAQKQSKKSYKLGQTIEFHQNATGFVSGTQLDVVEVDQEHVWVLHNKVKCQLDLSKADRFTVFEQRDVAMSAGDRVIATRNRMANRGGRLNCGHFYTVKEITSENGIVLDPNHAFPNGHAHVMLGYAVSLNECETLPVVHDVILSASVSAFSEAGGWPQFQRVLAAAKEEISIYSDDIEGLKMLLAPELAHEAARELPPAVKLKSQAPKPGTEKRPTINPITQSPPTTPKDDFSR
jgi:conjugative relaxase-like TrwC/TraI family protein